MAAWALFLAGGTAAAEWRRSSFIGDDVRFAVAASADSSAAPVIRRWSENNVHVGRGSISEAGIMQCGEGDNRYWDTVGGWLASNTREPRPGFLPVLNGLTRNARYNVSQFEDDIVTRRERAFLAEGDRLDKKPLTSAVDVRQRAEWLKNIDMLIAGLSQSSQGGDFSHNYSIALWTRARCRLQGPNKDAVAAALTDETLSAAIAAHPPTGKALTVLVEAIGDAALAASAEDTVGASLDEADRARLAALSGRSR